MNVDYTGRQYEVTPALRKQIENGLSKIEKILSTHFDTHVILSAEKHRHIAEITVSVRNHNIVGVSEATDMTAAVGQALDRIERQAVKYKTRWRSKKQRARKKWNGEASVEEQQLAVGATVTTAVPVVVHAFPSIVRTAEAHVTLADDAVALRPLTLEEAIKEAEFRDRDVFVFRDNKGRVKVLHRTKDGKMELIEAP